MTVRKWFSPERPRGGSPDARAPESTERPRGGSPDARAPEGTASGLPRMGHGTS